MKRVLAVIVVLSLVAAILATPTPAFARGGGRFLGGLALGAITGVIVGSAFAPPVYYAPPPVVYQPAPVYVAPPVYAAPPAPMYAAPPAPVYVAPPAPVCGDYWVDGYWTQYGWVQPQWQRVCR
ncbi:MAG TPA: hypothetical protein VGW35_15050 [Methylomirabilota bacterium]|jgi:hypothetical protein|nr:hypothetical protein [Methylomirabilota bacterium]